jgi:hypothetical protein
MIGRKTRAQEWTEMMALNPATPPPPAESHIAVGDLLQILNNAPALKEHIAKINAAHAKNKKDFEASKLRVEAEHADHLAAQAREAAEVLAKDRKQFAADRDSFAKDRAAAWAPQGSGERPRGCGFDEGRHTPAAGAHFGGSD